MSEKISNPSFPNPDSLENPNSSDLKLNSSQIAEVRKFLGEGNQDLLKFENENFPKAIALISVGENGKFECNLLIAKPVIYGTKWENNELLVTGKAMAKNDLAVVYVKDENGKIEKVETTAQNAMTYAHAGNGDDKNGQEISGVFWNDGENGEFEIPIEAHQIPKALLNGVKIRSTLFTDVISNGNNFDCRGKSGIINQEDKQNIGQRSEFSQIIKPEIPLILQTSFLTVCLILGIIVIKKIRKH